MVGGYQIIDLNDFVKVGTEYIPTKYFKPDPRKPVRLNGIKGKSENNPDLDSISAWSQYNQVDDGDGIVTSYIWTNNDSSVSVIVNIATYDVSFGDSPFPIYCDAIITDNNM